MSFEALKWAFNQHAGSPTNFAVLLAVANHADSKGFCFPSQETLAEECDCTRKTIRTALQALERSNLVKRTRRWKKDGHRSSDALYLPIQSLGVKSTHRNESLRVNLDVPKGKDYPASILNQSLNLKEGKMVWKVMQTDGPSLDRYADADLFKAGEKLMGQKVPVYMNAACFPHAVVAQAKAELEAKSSKTRAGERG